MLIPTLHFGPVQQQRKIVYFVPRQQSLIGPVDWRTKDGSGYMFFFNFLTSPTFLAAAGEQGEDQFNLSKITRTFTQNDFLTDSSANLWVHLCK